MYDKNTAVFLKVRYNNTMSNFWKILLLILLNVIVSASVTFGVLYYWDRTHSQEPQYELLTLDKSAGEPTAADVEAVPFEEPTAEAEQVDVPEDETEATAEPTPVIRGAAVEISIIRSPGDLSSEALRIVSKSDDVVSLEGWTLEDANGNVLTFPNIQLLRKGIFVEVYSRTGHTTPYEIYWNKDAAVWQPGETAVLKDVFGQIQATYRIP